MTDNTRLSLHPRRGVLASALAVALLGAAATAGHAAWPMFRGTSRQLGVAPGKLAKKLKLSWKFKTQGALTSSAVLDRGRVYVGAGDGTLFALDQKTGKRLWSYKTKGRIEAPPCAYGGAVAVGADDGLLYCVNSASGKLMWRYKTDDKILGSANAVPAPDGKGYWLLVGSYDNRLHCVNGTTGRKIWAYETDNYVNGTPAVSNGQVIFGGCDGMLYVLRLIDGQKVRSIEIKDYIAGSTALDGVNAYLGHYGNEVVCADVQSGRIVWTYTDRRFPFFSSPAVAADRIVIGGRDKQLHCINRLSGKGIWKFRTRGNVDSSPVICDGKVVVGSEDGRLYMVGLGDGKELWSYEIGQPVMSSPAVSDGSVVVGAKDGYVYAFTAA